MKTKRKKCKQCTELFEPFNSLQVVCSTPCAILFSKQRKAEDKQTIKRLTKEKAQRLKLPNVLKQTQIVFNKYIRLRDKHKKCISSDIPWKFDFDAGHLFSVKQYSGLRFNEDNVHGQSIGDNRFKEGNFVMYVVSVQDRIGRERYLELHKLATECKRTPKKWSIEEVLDIKQHYLKKCKELEHNKRFGIK